MIRPTRRQNGNAIMVGIPDIFTGRSLAYGLSTLGNVSARPNFELQYNILQNSVVDRINKELENIQASSTETVDVVLVSTKNKLTIFRDNVHTFVYQNSRNAWTVADLKTKVDGLSAALNNGDTAGANVLLAQIDRNVGNMTVPNGTSIGIFLQDRIAAIRRDGLINVDRGSGPIKITSFSQFANNGEAVTAYNNAIAKLDSVANAVLANAEGAEKLRGLADKNLVAVSLEIESAKLASQAEQAAALKKVRDQYAQFLNALSLAFEGNQAMAEQLGKNLFNPNQISPGSVMNMFA